MPRGSARVDGEATSNPSRDGAGGDPGTFLITAFQRHYRNDAVGYSTTCRVHSSRNTQLAEMLRMVSAQHVPVGRTRMEE